MEIELGYYQAKAMLEWQVELGVDEVIGEAPVNRYEVPKVAPKPVTQPPVAVPAIARPVEVDAVAEAQAAAQVDTLDALQAAMVGFELCEMKRGARNTVFADGNPAARVMVIGEAPGRDEDIQGKPFVGRAGQLLDRMFDAISMGRTHPDAERALYITNVLPWRPPQNRKPTPAEVAMLMPFVKRHVELIDPQVIVAMGNTSCMGLMGREGITRLRGNWTEYLGKPVLPMFNPTYLLGNPHNKREAWQDLLTLQARLRDLR